MEDTLHWRREFGFYDLITPEHVEPEGMTGKEVVFGTDRDRKPGLYMFPSRQNTDESIRLVSRVQGLSRWYTYLSAYLRQVHYATFMLERTIELAGPGVE